VSAAQQTARLFRLFAARPEVTSPMGPRTLDRPIYQLVGREPLFAPSPIADYAHVCWAFWDCAANPRRPDRCRAPLGSKRRPENAVQTWSSRSSIAWAAFLSGASGRSFGFPSSTGGDFRFLGRSNLGPDTPPNRALTALHSGGRRGVGARPQCRRILTRPTHTLNSRSLNGHRAALNAMQRGGGSARRPLNTLPQPP